MDDRYATNPISCAVETFRQHLDFFAEYFDVIQLSELTARLARGEAIGHSLVITFDDGYRDNLVFAAPELLRRKLPATFFITTGFVGSRTVPWWDRGAGIESEWMDWDQVRDLVGKGFEIGSHSATHPDFGKITSAEALIEVETAKAELRSRTGADPIAFAIPFGGRKQLSPENDRVIRLSGHACCLFNVGGLVRPNDDPMALDRMPVSPWYDDPYQFGFDLLRYHTDSVASRAERWRRRIDHAKGR